MRCFRCSSRGNYGLHHIDGSGQTKDPNDNPKNLIVACPTCHDYIQGFCDHCSTQPYCIRKIFLECWEFEDAIPPIHFKKKNSEVQTESKTGSCPKCGSTNMARITKWTVPLNTVYNNQSKYRALYHCKKCHTEFKRTLSKSEQAWDIDHVPIEITNWNLTA